jgi:hypothetical protein
MNAHLPTILTLTASKGNAEQTDSADGFDGHALEARLAEALLGDALLTPDDLPATWVEAEPGGSMVAGSDYEALALGDVRRAFEEPRTGRRIEQQLAVLPRWAARDLPAEEPATPAQSIAAAGHDGGGVQLLDRTAVAGRTAEIVRYGTVVMALRYADGRGGTLPAAVSDLVHARCRELAQTLQ